MQRPKRVLGIGPLRTPNVLGILGFLGILGIWPKILLLGPPEQNFPRRALRAGVWEGSGS